ncbi:MAG: lytic transglycosylase domain-containing protein, partial [Sphingomonadaceae bacterium]
VGAPRTWLQRRLTLARAAWRRGDPRLAELILANHGMTIGPDTLAMPLGVRVDLSDTEWLAGWLALRHNGRADAAVQHFTRFGQIVQTPISRARGDYWLGRAEAARGRQAEARAAFERAATYFDTFYGQLAAEELGQTVALPVIAPVTVPEAERAAVEASRLAQAFALLGAAGDLERQSPFVRALASAARTPAARRAAAEFGLRRSRPDLAVWIWRDARPQGDLSLFDLAFPRLPAGAPVPADRFIYAHAIARQESSFDTTALSSAGARGLMQLMPATAADVAKRLGLPFDQRRLFTDPAYNVQLGSHYLGMRRDGLGNWMLAAAAYNAGLGNVRRFIAANGDPRELATTHAVIDWMEAIPIAETRSYVQRVTENAVIYSLLEPGRSDSRPRASAWIRG